jgi:hypothetical protein
MKTWKSDIIHSAGGQTVDEAEKFWIDFEARTGEKVVARSMGIWHENGEEKGPWGILILTDKSFRYKYMPSDRLILGLFRSPDSTGAKREALELVAPLEGISLVEETERGWFARLFGSPFRRFEISWDEAEESARRQESFSVDPSGDFIGKLRRSVSG